MLLEIFIDCIKSDIKQFKIFLNNEKNINKKDVENFLVDLEIKVVEFENEIKNNCRYLI